MLIDDDLTIITPAEQDERHATDAAAIVLVILVIAFVVALCAVTERAVTERAEVGTPLDRPATTETAAGESK